MKLSSLFRMIVAVLLGLSLGACHEESTPPPPPKPPQLPLQIFNRQSGLPNNEVFDILTDSQGRTWFATNENLGLLEGGNLSRIGQPEGLLHPNLRCLAEFGGKIYIGSWGGGVLIYDGASWEALVTRDGLLSNKIYSVAVDDSSLWFATIKGVSQYVPDSDKFISYVGVLPKNRWTPVKKGILQSINTSSVEVANTSRGPEVWFGAKYQFVTVWRPEIEDYFVYNLSNSAIPGEGINDILYNADDGLYWVAFALYGVASIDVDNSAWRQYTMVDGLPSDVVYSIALDQAGRLWVGTNGGVARKEGDTFLAFTKGSGLPDERVQKVYSAPDGEIWLGFVDAGAARIIQ